MKILILDTCDTQRCRLRLAADSAWRPDRRPLFVPEGDAAVMATLRLALRISRLGKTIAPDFASRYYDAWAIALLRDTEATAITADDSIVLGPWQPLDTLPLSATCGDATLPIDLPRQSVDTAIAALSRGMTFKTGDIILLPEPVTALTLTSPSTLTVTAPGATLLQFNIR